MMSQENYKMIAEVLNKIYHKHIIRQQTPQLAVILFTDLVHELEHVFKKDNNRFDINEFDSAVKALLERTNR